MILLALARYGELISTSTAAFKQDFNLFMKLGFWLLLIPGVIFTGGTQIYEAGLPVNPLTGQAMLDGTAVALEVASSVITSLLMIILMAAIIRVLVERRAGKELAFNQAFKAGRAYFWPAFGLTIIMTIFLIGLYILLIIPGIIFSVYWIFAFYALVSGDAGIMESLSLSKKVVKGRWWRTFGFSLLFGLSLAALGLVIGLIFGVISGIVMVLNMIAGIIVMQILLGLLFMFYLPFATMFYERFYVDMKSNKAA